MIANRLEQIKQANERAAATNNLVFAKATNVWSRIASGELEFEKAAQTRDLIDSVKHISDRQQMSSTGGEDRDVIACAANETDAVVTVFFVRDGKIIGRGTHAELMKEKGYYYELYTRQYEELVWSDKG